MYEEGELPRLARISYADEGRKMRGAKNSVMSQPMLSATNQAHDYNCNQQELPPTSTSISSTIVRETKLQLLQ